MIELIANHALLRGLAFGLGAALIAAALLSAIRRAHHPPESNRCRHWRSSHD